MMIEDQTAPKRCGHVAGNPSYLGIWHFEGYKQHDARNELQMAGIGDILILARTDARCISMDKLLNAKDSRNWRRHYILEHHSR